MAGAVPPAVLRRFLMADVLPMDLGVECFDADHEDKDEKGLDKETEKDADVEGGEEGKAAAAGEGEDAGGRMDVVLPRLTKLPAAATRVFRCADPNQRGITLELFEGILKSRIYPLCVWLYGLY